MKISWQGGIGVDNECVYYRNGKKILYRSVLTKIRQADENGERPESGDWYDYSDRW